MKNSNTSLKMTNKTLSLILIVAVVVGAERNRPTSPKPRRLTTRSPNFDRIQQWKTELSSDLGPLRKALPELSCHYALHTLCLQHIACKELWKIFRQSCQVDDQNQCRMINRNDCWQSFEGISWTGLGNCACHGNNSDCHWIRLQTNYNKCIFEIANEGLENGDPVRLPFPLPTSPAPLPLSSTYNRNDHAITGYTHFHTTQSPHEAQRLQTEAVTQAHLDQQRRRDAAVSRHSHSTHSHSQRHRQTSSSSSRSSGRSHAGHAGVDHHPRPTQRPYESTTSPTTPMSTGREQLEVRTTDVSDMANGSSSTTAWYQIWPKPTNEPSGAYDPKPSAEPREQESMPTAERTETSGALDLKIRPSSLMKPLPSSKPSEAREIKPSNESTRKQQDLRLKPTSQDQPYPSSGRYIAHDARPEPTVQDLRRRTSDGDSIRPSIGDDQSLNIRPRLTVRFNGSSWDQVRSTNMSEEPKTKLDRKPTEAQDLGIRPTSRTYGIQSTASPMNNVEIHQVPSQDDSQLSQPYGRIIYRGSTRKETAVQYTLASTARPGFVAELDPTKNPTLETTVQRPPVVHTGRAMSTQPPLLPTNTSSSSVGRPGLIFTKKSPLKEYELNDGSTTTNASLISSTRSTCREAQRACERSETCKWHLSELQIKCPTEKQHCVREQCAKAVSRFTRFVSRSLVENLMFCRCGFGDGECRHVQQWLYPVCLYSHPKARPRWSCSQSLKLCQSESACLRQLNALNSSCPVSKSPNSNGSHDALWLCSATDFAQCRRALIEVRGSQLETPCYCDAGDQDCVDKQNRVMLPNNPCIEQAMIDYGAEDKSKAEVKKEMKYKTKDELGPSAGSTSDLGDMLGPKPTPTPTPSSEADKDLTTTPKPTSSPSTEITSLKPSLTSTESSSETDDSTDLLSGSSLSPGLTSGAENYTETSPTSSTIDPKKLKRRKNFRGEFLPTGDYVAQPKPPADGGCTTRNIDGEWIVHYKDSVFRQYSDWSGRCSSWCECTGNESVKCQELGCLSDVLCEALHTTVGFGEKLYLEGRGACVCQSGRFICESSEESVDLSNGLYLSLGYSKEELKIIKEKIPKVTLERNGFVSSTRSLAKDLATRLQFALERVLPDGTKCRIAVLEHFEQEAVMVMQVQWYGVDRFANETKEKWHVGRMEKLCSPYVRELEHNFLLEKADRYQLALSIVKQLKVLDLLDGLPAMSLTSGCFDGEALGLVWLAMMNLGALCIQRFL